ncbi:MAG: hypothetical protein ACRDMV_14145 [Streptosporangiales bacterium]
MGAAANVLQLVPEVSRGTSIAPDAAARTLPVLPALADLLPGGGLRRGASYTVQGSPALALALLAGPSAAGSWCAAVGAPALGMEAAAELGVDLGRLALVPAPGRQWLRVVAVLVDAFDVVLIAPPGQVGDADARRLAARCADRGATLVALGPWKGAELRFMLTASQWYGLGCGHGHLAGRQVTVTVAHRPVDRLRVTRLWLPAADGSVRAVADEVPSLREVG